VQGTGDRGQGRVRVGERHLERVGASCAYSFGCPLSQLSPPLDSNWLVHSLPQIDSLIRDIAFE
ncbi:MAG: hypothetical protein ACREAC_08555, partial [Blastocatellia bacterium]